MGGRQAGERSHTKAPCLSKGSGCLAVSEPWAEVETEAEVYKIGVSRKTELHGG